MATFVSKFVTENFQKLPSLITLLSTFYSWFAVAEGSDF